MATSIVSTTAQDHDGECKERSKTGRTARIVATIVLLVTALALVIASPYYVDREIDLVPTTGITSVEIYEYPYLNAPSKIEKTLVEDPGVIAQIGRGFRDVPTRKSFASREDLAGKTATMYRFNLRDGNTVQVTRVFQHYKSNVFLLPDGKTFASLWGMPLNGYYRELGEVSTVDSNFE